MKVSINVSSVLAVLVALVSLSLPACERMRASEGEGEEGQQEHHHTIIVTSPEAKDVVVTKPYVCQIHSRRHIEVRALEEGYLEPITVKEGQAVKDKQVLFTILPVLYKARLEAEEAEAQYAQVELTNTEQLNGQNIVSNQEVALYRARLAKAKAKVALARAELQFTYVKAPFEGIMGRQLHQQGSLIKKDEILTTLSDNSVMWVYFNVPEATYLNYLTSQGKGNENLQRLKIPNAHIELLLATGKKFAYGAGDTVTVEAKFNNTTGNIQFRADFPNPDRLLRHGQTGTVLIHQTLPNSVVIPQRATFELLDKQYVWVVGEDHVVHRRLLTIRPEPVEDRFVVEDGLKLTDKIIVEGVRQVRDGDKIEYEFHKPDEVLAHQKNPAE
jgi:membrane fusion protein (multidrug efflux system)